MQNNKEYVLIDVLTYLFVGCTSSASIPPLQNVCKVTIGDIGGFSNERGSVNCPIPMRDLAAPNTKATRRNMIWLATTENTRTLCMYMRNGRVDKTE